jgi:hypothetical protein
MQDINSTTVLDFIRSDDFATAYEQFKASKQPKKEPETWLTEDAVEVPIFENGAIWYVDSNKFDGARSLTFSKKVEMEAIKERFPHFKYFSTCTAAQTYIENHRPVLSLNDVREACEHLYGNSKDIVLANAAALVKQKLNS